MKQHFGRLVTITLAAVYLLILIGGIVRSTGSGMGCPDWPKCFGKWIPPVSVTELPDNYKEEYSSYRDKKNQRFAGFLYKVGMRETADRLLRDERILQEADFNAAKTWMEYINRLFGAAVGLLISVVCIASLFFWNVNRRITLVGVLALVVVAITGWFGSIVVSSNLTPWTVTLHMFMAVVLVALLVYLRMLSMAHAPVSGKLKGWLGLALILSLIQVFLGTQVREGVDVLYAQSVPRSNWVEELGSSFIIHRSFSWLVLFVNAYAVFHLARDKNIKAETWLLAGILVFTVLAGALMSWFSIPAFLQPLHLVFALLLFGQQLGLWLRAGKNEAQLNLEFV
jgi:cytochrome c oxidase assembly protein subunit 15